jgi:cysteine synthase A
VHNRLKHLVGNTPLLAIACEDRGRRRTVYAKAEHLNLTGSIKDRMALHILERAWTEGRLSPGQPIAEATSGNTGIAMAGVGRATGHPVTVFMPDGMSRERIELIKSLGATIHLVDQAHGGFLGAIRLAEECSHGPDGAFLPRQFSNEDNCGAHEATTGPEILWQLREHGLTPDAFVAGVGTGGTVMGVGRCLKRSVPGVKIHPLEPASSPTLSAGHKVGKHRIQGISDEFVPPIVDLDFLDEIVAVDDGDAILMAQKLASELGLGVGISSGANFLGALKLLEDRGEDAVVVTIFCDDNKKYLSTDLVRDEPMRDGYLSSGVRLTGFDVFKRVCATCWEPSDASA